MSDLTGPQHKAAVRRHGRGPGAKDSASRNFYGRLRGKSLKPNQRRWLQEDLGVFRMSGVGRDENPARLPLARSALPGSGAPVWLEIGFGGGEHLVHMAGLHPQIGFIGCEPYINGVARLLGRARAAGLVNLALHPGDVRDLFDVLPERSIARAFLNYPDPWPKTRHHRRRFVTPEYLLPLARILQPQAQLRLATDIPDYVRQARQELPPAGFALLDEGTTPWPDWPGTRYEAKALREGRSPHYQTWARRD